jgi:hypothetical protein
MMFSGSYDPTDVTFLLKRVRLEPTPVAEKERLIQSGKRHYSEMISAEALPSPVYLDVFCRALERQKARFARHLIALARLIAEARGGEIALVSLARAGTPVGVILTRILRAFLGRSVQHYSISIIRDRGIDATALRFILSRHPASAVSFVDGWTGKGVISRELRQSVARFNETEGRDLDPGLFAVADLCGEADCAATDEDYLIPSSVLGCTVSGLVSRSILNDAVVGPDDFHGCLFHEEYAAHDLSCWFVEELMKAIRHEMTNPMKTGRVVTDRRALLRQRSEAFLRDIGRRFGIHDVNRIKPGIGEATRVLLRRVPDRLLLREPDHSDVEHLRVLAGEKQVPIDVEPELPFLAAALIKEVSE